ncbi:hypothetical protein MAY82_16360 [Edwardsiella ictaluri]|nr:hypothetical protein MAY82_16360 [Edwardsiella ictaluri]
MDKPWIGDARRAVTPDDISRTVRLMWVASALALALLMAVRWLVAGAA